MWYNPTVIIIPTKISINTKVQNANEKNLHMVSIILEKTTMRQQGNLFGIRWKKIAALVAHSNYVRHVWRKSRKCENNVDKERIEIPNWSWIALMVHLYSPRLRPAWRKILKIKFLGACFCRWNKQVNDELKLWQAFRKRAKDIEYMFTMMRE